MWRVSGPTNQWSKPIIACMGGKEFALADVINMEKAIIPFFSKPEQVAEALPSCTGIKREDKRVRGGGQGDNGWKKLFTFP